MKHPSTQFRKDGTLKICLLRRRALLTPKARTYTYRNPDARPSPESPTTWSIHKMLQKITATQKPCAAN